MYSYVCAFVYVSMYVCMNECMYACMYVCMNAFVYVYICMHVVMRVCACTLVVYIFVRTSVVAVVGGHVLSSQFPVACTAVSYCARSCFRACIYPWFPFPYVKYILNSAAL